ncbi:MAG TPA: metallophosphoesterase family protein [Thermoleophilaceae bacterium]|nr:metallophosphoesterase family protein [Thermoleophilaceae bacterium]
MLALLYDVHGNLLALEAVLEDASNAGADRFLLGGDYAVAGGWPLETVERLKQLDARWIRGNADRWLADAPDAPEPMQAVIEKAREALGDELIAELAGLPESADEGDVLYCHGSPESDMKSFLPDPSDLDAELLNGVQARRVVFGHTHLAFQRTGPGGIELVNPGSVGLPWDGDHRSAYALVHDDGRVEQRRVEYDWRAAAAAVRERAGDLPARRLEQARFDVPVE